MHVGEVESVQTFSRQNECYEDQGLRV